MEVGDALLEKDEINLSRQYRNHENVITTSLKNDLVQEGQTSKDMVKAQSSKFMVRSNLN